MPDFEVPSRYLRDNFDRNDRLAVVLIERASARVDQKFATAGEIATPAFQSGLRSANAGRWDLYVTWNRTAEILSF